jgi:hypothetical protein
MRLGIVIPLKSKKVSKNWQVTCDNLLLTINSITNQTLQEFSLVIVGHERPIFLDYKKNNNVYFQSLIEIEPPRKTSDKENNHLLYEEDRCTKILKGINYLRSIDHKITHWFPVDADDLIDKNFIEYLCNFSVPHIFDAIIIKKGYIYYKRDDIFTFENNISCYCGSSAILADRLVDDGLLVEKGSYKNFIFGNTSHVHMFHSLEQRGLNIHIPKRRLIAYCKDNGENISSELGQKSKVRSVKVFFKKKFKRAFFDLKIKKAFSLI